MTRRWKTIGRSNTLTENYEQSYHGKGQYLWLRLLSRETKALTPGRTGHFSNILNDHRNGTAVHFSDVCYLFTVSNSDLLLAYIGHASSYWAPVFLLWPRTLTLTFELDLGSIKMNQHVKHLGQMSLSSKVIVRTHGQTHTPGRLLYLDH